MMQIYQMHISYKMKNVMYLNNSANRICDLVIDLEFFIIKYILTDLYYTLLYLYLNKILVL